MESVKFGNLENVKNSDDYDLSSFLEEKDDYIVTEDMLKESELQCEEFLRIFEKETSSYFASLK